MPQTFTKSVYREHISDHAATEAYGNADSYCEFGSACARSSFSGTCCRFIPTCSEYAIQSFKQFSPAQAAVLMAWRLIRCNPTGGYGVDEPQWPPPAYWAGSQRVRTPLDDEASRTRAIESLESPFDGDAPPSPFAPPPLQPFDVPIEPVRSGGDADSNEVAARDAEAGIEGGIESSSPNDGLMQRRG